MPDLRKFYYLPTASETNREPDLTNSFNWKLQGTWYPPALFQFVQIDAEHGVKVPVINYNDLSAEERDKQMRFKKILGILNKITLDNYRKLILLLGLDSMDSSFITMLAEIIFSKALDDDMYIHLYSKLCEEIIAQLSPESCEVFKCVLRDLCDLGFKSTLQTRDSDIQNIDGRKQLMFKRILMSIIRFTTELSFINNPLYDRSHCINLIKKLIDTGELLHLEAVYFIWTTSAMRYSDFTWPDSLSSTIDKLAEGVGVNGEAVTPRIRFMFLSLVDTKNGILRPFQFVPYQDSLKASDLEEKKQVNDCSECI